MDTVFDVFPFVRFLLFLSLASLLPLFLASRRCCAATVHVSPDGADDAPGSPERPWRTTARVNRERFQPGDSILFQGGGQFHGGLRFDSGGTPESPITVGSYGGGRAAILSHAEHGILVHNAAGFVIRDLAFCGSGVPQPTGEGKVGSAGVCFHNDLPETLEGVTIENVEASGYRGAGIRLGTANASGGYRSVRIVGCEAHDNADVGIYLYGVWKHRSHRQVYVAHCRAHHNRGIAGKGEHSGSGILLGQVEDATIEYCEAFENGECCDCEVGGPCGIWVWDADRAVIQRCISHHNKSVYKDGCGFDLDGDTVRSVIQYCVSYANRGAGYGLFNFPGAGVWEDNVLRYNLSQNDGMGISVWNVGEDFRNSRVYNNTVVNDLPGHPALEFLDHNNSGIFFRNNLFMAVLLVAGGTGGETFQGNVWHPLSANP